LEQDAINLHKGRVPISIQRIQVAENNLLSHRRESLINQKMSSHANLEIVAILLHLVSVLLNMISQWILHLNLNHSNLIKVLVYQSMNSHVNLEVAVTILLLVNALLNMISQTLLHLNHNHSLIKLLSYRKMSSHVDLESVVIYFHLVNVLLSIKIQWFLHFNQAICPYSAQERTKILHSHLNKYLPPYALTSY
jgi:hypothetical protein